MAEIFEAVIYKVGINACVDVPSTVTKLLIKEKGFIYVNGTINNAPFKKSLVPVKNHDYRLFVDLLMLKQASAKIGERAHFSLSQSHKQIVKYEMPQKVRQMLEEKDLLKAFYLLSDSKRKSILKYICSIKTDKTLEKNISKLVFGLESGNKNISLP